MRTLKLWGVIISVISSQGFAQSSGFISNAYNQMTNTKTKVSSKKDCPEHNGYFDSKTGKTLSASKYKRSLTIDLQNRIYNILEDGQKGSNKIFGQKTMTSDEVWVEIYNIWHETEEANTCLEDVYNNWVRVFESEKKNPFTTRDALKQIRTQISTSGPSIKNMTDLVDTYIKLKKIQLSASDSRQALLKIESIDEEKKNTFHEVANAYINIAAVEGRSIEETAKVFSAIDDITSNPADFMSVTSAYVPFRRKMAPAGENAAGFSQEQSIAMVHSVDDFSTDHAMVYNLANNQVWRIVEIESKNYETIQRVLASAISKNVGSNKVSDWISAYGSYRSISNIDQSLRATNNTVDTAKVFRLVNLSFAQREYLDLANEFTIERTNDVMERLNKIQTQSPNVTPDIKKSIVDFKSLVATEGNIAEVLKTMDVLIGLEGDYTERLSVFKHLEEKVAEFGTGAYSSEDTRNLIVKLDALAVEAKEENNVVINTVKFFDELTEISQKFKEGSKATESFVKTYLNQIDGNESDANVSLDEAIESYKKVYVVHREGIEETRKGFEKIVSNYNPDESLVKNDFWQLTEAYVTSVELNPGNKDEIFDHICKLSDESIQAVLESGANRNKPDFIFNHAHLVAKSYNTIYSAFKGVKKQVKETDKVMKVLTDNSVYWVESGQGNMLLNDVSQEFVDIYLARGGSKEDIKKRKRKDIIDSALKTIEDADGFKIKSDEETSSNSNEN